MGDAKNGLEVPLGEKSLLEARSVVIEHPREASPDFLRGS